MKKELLEKVLDILLKHDVDKAVLDEVESLKEDDAPVEGDDKGQENEPAPAPEDAPVEGEGETTPVAEEESEPVEGDALEGDVPPVDEVPTDEVPPVEEPAPSEPGLPEGTEEVQLGQGVPPVEEIPAEPLPTETPQVDYEAQIAEQAKTIEGLKSRISSLEEALRKGGILEDEAPKGNPVGVDDPTNLNDYHDDDATLDDTIERLNRRSGI